VALLAGGCAAAPLVVSQAPPPARDDPPTRKPASHVFWQGGRWAWDDAKGIYFWSAGGWVAERPGELWIPGYWRRVEEEGQVEGWTWVEPRWERLPESP
jgi:hypothetical protein